MSMHLAFSIAQKLSPNASTGHFALSQRKRTKDFDAAYLNWQIAQHGVKSPIVAAIYSTAGRARQDWFGS
jgi:predicted outer membrane protein